MNTVEFLDTLGLEPNRRPEAFGTGRPTGAAPYVQEPVTLDRLHTLRPTPNQERKYEQPWHESLMYMMASGKWTMKAAAEELEKSYATILAVCKNAWFQEKVILTQRANGAQDIMDLFRAEIQSSALTLIELRDSKEVAPSVRRACAVDILERFLGKPVQKVETKSEPTSADPVAEVARLEQENNRLRGQSCPSPASSSEQLEASTSN